MRFCVVDEDIGLSAEVAEYAPTEVSRRRTTLPPVLEHSFSVKR